MKKLDEIYEKTVSSFFNTETARNWPKDRPWPGIPDETLRNAQLVLEDKHKEVNIGQPALGYLKSQLKEDIISLLDNEKLKKKILKDWKYYKDFCVCCMDKNLWILQTDFSRHQKAERLLKNRFDAVIDLEGSMKNTAGLTVALSDRDFAILLDLKANERKLQHEFTHCVQLVTGKILGNLGSVPEEVKRFFNLSPEYESYVFNEHEFWANVFNDLFNDLQKHYWLHDKQMKWEDYIGGVGSELLKNALSYRDSLFGTEWKNDGCSSLFLDLLACIGYVNTGFFNQIIDKLKNR